MSRRAALASLLGLAACTSAYDLETIRTEVPRASGPVAISVIDLRPAVVSGRRPPNFVGVQQIGVGEPLDVLTRSGRPLAEEFARVLAGAFDDQGTEVWVVPLGPRDDADAAFAGFLQSPSDRFLLLEMAEWQTDTLIEVSVRWDLAVRVYDREGQVLAEETSRGSRAVEGTVILDEQKGRIAREEAARLFAELLGRPAIAEALAAPA